MGKISANELAEKYSHSNIDSHTTLKSVPNPDAETSDGEVEMMDLRVCGVGSEAFLEWITEYGDPIGEVFDEIDEAELASTQIHSQESLNRLLEEAVQNAIDAGCAHIQKGLGIATGDAAGMHFASGPALNAITQVFGEYLKLELDNGQAMGVKNYDAHAAADDPRLAVLEDIGYDIREDSQQPGLWLWTASSDGSEISFQSLHEALDDAWTDAVDQTLSMRNVGSEEWSAMSFDLQKAAVLDSLSEHGDQTPRPKG